MTSLWTTLSVPWTLDYHDTYFAFTLAKTGPVVLVLSQLDDRYYRGLEGQYRFGLNFRLHKIGQEDYVVRTISPYCQTRSVNVELELEAGEYTVLLKVNATRNRDVLPIEGVVRRNARDRRDKLVAVGMSYDLAHSKGQVPTGETAEERRAKREAENRRKEKNRDDFRKVIMKDRVDDHYLKVKARQRRLKRKTNAKAKAKAKAAREAEKEKKAKARNEAKDVQEKPKDDVEASENSAFATPQEIGTDAKDTNEGSSENKKEAHVHIVAPDEIPSPEGFKAPSSEPSVKTPSAGSNESPSNVSPKSEKPTAESSEELPLAECSKTVEDKPDTKEEAEANNSHEDAIKVIQGEEENEKLGGKSEGLSKEEKEDASKHENIPEEYKDSLLEEDGEDDQDDEDDEISSLSSFSDLSDRELDIRLERMAEADAQPLAPGSPQQRPRSRPPPAPAPQGDDDEPDEFESDPWNAVATVGLRVYHKVADEDDRDREMVKLRVVRPNPYLAGKEGRGEEDRDEDENRDKKDSGGDKEGKGNEKDKEKEKEKEKEKGEDDKKEEVVDEPKSSQGLDVDDSSKDATLVGNQEQRRKSILSLIPPRQG